MTPEQKFSELFVKAAYSRSANIAVQGIEAVMAGYKEDVRKLTNDRRRE